MESGVSGRRRRADQQQRTRAEIAEGRAGGFDAVSARALALSLLARREHGREELRGKLIRKGCPAGLAEETVERLVRERLLSEDRFIESFINARRGRGYGPLRIREELRGKGIAEELIESSLDVNAPDWVAELRQVRSKKFGNTVPKDFAGRARQARFLQYRGFTAEQIQKILNGRDSD